jgi:hypothetical protein
VLLEDHKTVDHIRRLSLSGVYEETPVRDLCAQLNWKALKECFMFFVECGVKM